MPESSFAQVGVIPRKRKDEKFHQVACVKYTFEVVIQLLELSLSVYDKIITNKPICNVL